MQRPSGSLLLSPKGAALPYPKQMLAPKVPLLIGAHIICCLCLPRVSYRALPSFHPGLFRSVVPTALIMRLNYETIALPCLTADLEDQKKVYIFASFSRENHCKLGLVNMRKQLSWQSITLPRLGSRVRVPSSARRRRSQLYAWSVFLFLCAKRC